MHDTAMEYGGRFFEAYLEGTKGLTIVDIGAQDVNGSLRLHNSPENKYIGVDFVVGRGVDVILTDPYKLPFEDASVDAVVCSSCFEHSEFFWELYLEIIRILKPTGLFYLNVPSNGGFHRWPVDCWRFYPDSGKALERWAQRKGHPVTLLESFTGVQKRDTWNDFVAVFLKDEVHAVKFPNRILDRLDRYSNGVLRGWDDIQHFQAIPEDQRTGPIMHYVKQGTRLFFGVKAAAEKRLGRAAG